MEGVGAGARLGGEDGGGIRGQGRVGHRLPREDPRVGRADPVPVHGGRDVDQGHVRDVVRARIGHGAGDRPVERSEDHLCRCIGGGCIGLEAAAHEVGVQVGRKGVVGDLRRARNGLVVVENGDGAGVRGHRLDGFRQAGADVGENGGQIRSDGAVGHATRAEAEVRSEGLAQLVLQAAGEVDVVGPVLQQHETRRMPGQVRGCDLVAQVARLLWRHRALPVAGGVVRPVGDRPADGELVTREPAIGGPHRHGEAEVPGEQTRVGRQ